MEFLGLEDFNLSDDGIFNAENNEVNWSAYQPLKDVFPDGWFDDVRQLYGEGLSDEMIAQSVEETCDFFHIDEPAIVSEGWTTGVYLNNDFTMQDDFQIFNRDQLLDLGISGKDGLDLVMTHEGTHRVLQGMEHLEFDSHQEELCCDYMAGVRAGLNDIDVSQMENSLMYTPETETHPAGADRVESIEAGVRFAQEYYAEYNETPTFDECLDHFCEINEVTSQMTFGDANDIHLYGGQSTESTGSVGFVASEHNDNVSFKGYTQSEIDSKMSDAKDKQTDYKGKARHHLNMASNGLDNADREYHINEAKKYEKEADKCEKEYLKWKYTKPSK